MNTNEQLLKDFMSSYFHEDWALDAPSPREVVAQFFRDQMSADGLMSIARALRALANSGEDDEKLSARLFTEFGAYFDPRGVGEPTGAWLRALADDFDREIGTRT